MKTAQVDLLNVGLMGLSLAAAFLLPFQTFLFAYAVLGPLHYLTEISWLHQRDYFLPRRSQAGWLVLLLLPVLVLFYAQSSVAGEWVTPTASAGALGAAIAFVFLRETRARVQLIGASLAAGLALSFTSAGHDILRLFLPTIVHVWLFTGAFVLVGALRNRSSTGYLSLATFVACTLACFLAPVAAPIRELTEATAESYVITAGLNVGLADWLGLGVIPDAPTLFRSTTGLVVARFIAFAYTYHYLNWFSKTSVIQWHRMPRAWALSIVLLWAGSVALYQADFTLGLQALFALSYLHVFLELPLNGRSFAEIGQRLSGRATP